ncbi:FkbM family methyltransferase [Paraburkholderia megapolitana]|uniref:FkbM family methyltransferase n=1 Tax=Paraburkholderia megapolitana TaxID=420953 RepID=UPI0038B92A4F
MNINQIYTGIEPNDLAIFEKYRNSSASTAPGFYTDFMGVKTRLSYFGIQNTDHDKTVGRIPFPDDGLHAETIEYTAALYAVETSAASFTAVELGAGYGPWVTFSAKAALHAGIKNINLVAVEGDRPRHELLRTHFRDNDLPVPDQSGNGMLGEVKSKLIHAAISDSNGMVTFGSQSINDWGAAPVENGDAVDYRGFERTGEQINSYTIEHVIRDLDLVDFLHMDIQGFEARAVRASIEALKSKVRVMLIGTHSRQIEGELFAMLYGHGWRIQYEKPCKFDPREGHSLEALTTLDGTQVWVNLSLEDKRKASEMPEGQYLREVDSLRRRADAAEANAGREAERARFLQRKLDDANKSISALTREVSDLRHSTSWKITAPLRKVKGALRH